MIAFPLVRATTYPAPHQKDRNAREPDERCDNGVTSRRSFGASVDSSRTQRVTGLEQPQVIENHVLNGLLMKYIR